MTKGVKQRNFTLSDFIVGVKTEREAASYLGISKQTLTKLRKAGKIGFFRVGTRGVRYGFGHLHDYLKSVEREGGRP